MCTVRWSGDWAGPPDFILLLLVTLLPQRSLRTCSASHLLLLCCKTRQTSVTQHLLWLNVSSRGESIRSTVSFFHSYRWFPNRHGGVSGFGAPPVRRRAPQEQAGGDGRRHNWGQGNRLGEDWGRPPTEASMDTDARQAHNKALLQDTCFCIRLGFGSVFVSLLPTTNEKVTITRRPFAPRQRVRLLLVISYVALWPDFSPSTGSPAQRGARAEFVERRRFRGLKRVRFKI